MAVIRLEDKVGVRFQIAFNAVSHVVKIDAHPFAPCELEGRDHVAVAGDHDEDADQLAERQPCDVEANAQIHALLG